MSSTIEPLREPLPADVQAQAESAAVVNRAMEQLIMRCPGQYLWGYHRYKAPRQPPVGRSVGKLKEAGLASRLLLRLLWLVARLAVDVPRPRSAARWAASSGGLPGRVAAWRCATSNCVCLS